MFSRRMTDQIIQTIMLGRFNEAYVPMAIPNAAAVDSLKVGDTFWYSYEDSREPLMPSLMRREWKPTPFSNELIDDMIQFGGQLQEDSHVHWPCWYSRDNGETWYFLNAHRSGIDFEETL